MDKMGLVARRSNNADPLPAEPHEGGVAVTPLSRSLGQHSTKLARSPYSGAIADQLREAIVSGDLKEGTPLIEARLAADLNVSRGPVRTALHALEGEGLVRTLPNGRMVAERFATSDVRDLFDTRFELEAAAIREVVSRKLLLNDVEAALDAIVLEGFASRHVVDLDLALHQTIMVLSGRRFLAQAWLALAPVIKAVIAVGNRGLAATDPSGDFARIVKNHQLILEALRRSDAEDAVKRLGRQFAASQKLYTAGRVERRS